MLAKVIIGILGAISSILLARMLGPEARGTFGVALQLSTFGVQIGCLGINSSNLYYSAKDPSKVPIIAGNSLLISIVLGIIVIVVSSVFFYFFPTLQPLDGSMLQLSLFWVPLGILYLLLQNIFPGVQDIKSYNLAEIGFRAIGVILFVLVIVLFHSTSIELVYLTTYFPPLIISIWILWKLKSYGKISFDFKEVTSSISYSTRIYIATIFAFVMLKSNLFMIKEMLGATEAGYYSVVMNVSDLFSMISASIGMILYSKSSSMAENSRRWKMTLKSAALCSVLLLIAFTVYYFNDETIFRLLFGKEFDSAIVPFNYLLIGLFFMGVQTIFMQYLASIGLPKITLYLWGFGAVLYLILNTIFIPKYGLNGASIATSVSYFIFAVLVIICSFYYGKKVVIEKL